MPALDVRASVSSINVEKRTVDVVFATDHRVRRGFWEPYDEELSMDPKHVRMDRLNSGRAPVLDNHDSYARVGSQLGVIERASVDGKTCTATLRFAKAEDDPEADKVFRKIADKIIANVSVGYRVHKLEKIEAGNSIAGTVAVYRATDWEPFEVSPVLVPADPGAGFRSERQQSTNPVEVITRTEENEMTVKSQADLAAEAATAAGIEAARVAAAVEATRATEATANRDAAVAAATAAEQARGVAIRLAVRTAKLDESVADKMIGEKISIDVARAQVLDMLATKGDAVRTDQHNRVEIGDNDTDKFQRHAQAWLIQRAGLRSLFDQAAKIDSRHAVVSDPGGFRGMTLKDLARKSLAHRGFQSEGMDQHQMIGAAFTMRTGMQSTSDFATLMSST